MSNLAFNRTSKLDVRNGAFAAVNVDPLQRAVIGEVVFLNDVHQCPDRRIVELCGHRTDRAGWEVIAALHILTTLTSDGLLMPKSTQAHPEA
tara:strand:- start:1317 stop:1592 length:276 start_codon:yes stop_codon:yes gene_type:complete